MAIAHELTLSYNRDSTKDILEPVLPEHNLYAWYDSSATPQRVYTLSPSLSVGMELYDNTGTSISKTVGTINQDGSFDAVESTPSTVSLTIEYQAETETTTPSSTTVNGNTVSSLPSSVTVNCGESCTIVVTAPSNSEAYIYLDGTKVSYNIESTTYTFTTSGNHTIGVGRNISKS